MSVNFRIWLALMRFWLSC